MPNENEEYLPLVVAVESVTRRRPHLATATRWCQTGSRGIRLQSWFIGGRRLTTLLAVRQWVEAVSLAAGCNVAPIESPKQVSVRAAKASRDLASRLN